MSAGRWFVPRGTLDGSGSLTLPDAVAQQARSVLRLYPGDTVTLLDGSGAACTVELVEVGRERVTGRIMQRYVVATEPRHHLILYQALIKAAKFEWVVQKGTEIGVGAFVPLITARSMGGLEEASAQKLTRWRTIATEATEQSDRGRIPPIGVPQSLADSLHSIAANDIMLLPWEGAKTLTTTAKTIPAALAYNSQEPASGQLTIHLFIGPEGGFTAEEVALAVQHRAHIVTLGPRILRAETAAIVATTLVLNALGELN